jgi:ABC-2 type transport system permease protein
MGRIFVAALVRELRFLAKSRWNLALSTAMPAFCLALMAWLFIVATPRDMPIVAVDQDRSVLSRDALMRVDAAPAIRIAYACEDLACARPYVRSGKAFGVLYIPKNAMRDVAAGRKTHLVFYANASYFTASIVTARDAGNAVAALNAKLMVEEVARVRSKPVRPLPLDVQTTTLFNPFSSYEWMIVSLLHPALIVIFFSCAVITSVGREIAGRRLVEWIGAPCPSGTLAALAGKTAPYLAIYLCFGAACILWLTARGYPVNGSLAALLIGYALTLIAYIGLGTLIIGVVRDMPMTLGAAAIYASSALAFSGAFFPMRYGALFAQSWNAVQPFTWFTRLAVQQWQMGAPVAASLPQLGILAALAAGLIAGAVWALIYTAHEEGP